MDTRKLLTSTALPLILVLGSAGALKLEGEVPVAFVSTAQAQVNPCAPANPCAPTRGRQAVNPCAPANAPAAANPCAPANPCGATSPCAPARTGRPSAANPCAARPAFAGAAANPFDVPAGYKQAPYGDAMPNIVKNYLRAAPYVGTGGVIDRAAFGKLKALGFKTVINLNTDKEGAQPEGDAARKAGLVYIHIPVDTRAPKSDDVSKFTQYVNDPNYYPVLVHCQSANRVGAMWALYRAVNGVPPGIAVQEGRTVGLKPSREKTVRERLGLPPL